MEFCQAGIFGGEDSDFLLDRLQIHRLKGTSFFCLAIKQPALLRTDWGGFWWPDSHGA